MDGFTRTTLAVTLTAFGVSAHAGPAPGGASPQRSSPPPAVARSAPPAPVARPAPAPAPVVRNAPAPAPAARPTPGPIAPVPTPPKQVTIPAPLKPLPSQQSKPLVPPEVPPAAIKKEAIGATPAGNLDLRPGEPMSPILTPELPPNPGIKFEDKKGRALEITPMPGPNGAPDGARATGTIPWDPK